jgi:hypothetical protein
VGFSRVLDILQQCPLSKTSAFHRVLARAVVLQRWPEIVGRPMALNAQVSWISEQGVLYLSVKHPIWSIEVMSCRSQILQKLNSHAEILQHKAEIKDLRCFSAHQTPVLRKPQWKKQ